MPTRREFVGSALAVSAGLSLSALLVPEANAAKAKKRTVPYRTPVKIGMGGAPLGNNNNGISNAQAVGAVEGAWKAGARYFDTSPFYGYGLSERRFGLFLSEQKRSDYILSTKVGRVFKAAPGGASRAGSWVDPSPFNYVYDYSASATRRSIEDSLQRLGIESLDIVFIHDLAEENGDLGKKWKDHFEIARKGAMPELTKMREEGLIKAWGLGVNQSEPILKTLEVADPDIMLAARQYSLMRHEEAILKTFPACLARKVSIVVGSPLNNGFLTGADRYDYSKEIPAGYLEKRSRLQAVAKKYDVDLRTAALQFSAAHPAVSAVIPGARSALQSSQNVESMKVKIANEFWAELKSQKLIHEQAPTPTA